MKQKIMNEVLQKMLPYLDNAQRNQLKTILDSVLTKYEIAEELDFRSNEDMIGRFIEAKRIEGCSEKTLKDIRFTKT